MDWATMSNCKHEMCVPTVRGVSDGTGTGQHDQATERHHGAEHTAQTESEDPADGQDTQTDQRHLSTVERGGLGLILF